MELHIIRTVDHPIVNKLKYYFFLTTDKDELLSKIKN